MVEKMLQVIQSPDYWDFNKEFPFNFSTLCCPKVTLTLFPSIFAPCDKLLRMVAHVVSRLCNFCKEPRQFMMTTFG